MTHPWEAKWTMGCRLGKGGQGVTNQVTSTDGSGTLGALKVLKNNKDAQARGRMLQEIASLQSLTGTGANVPRVLDENTDRFLDASVELFVVMEYVPGKTLRQLSESGRRFDIDTAAAITLSILRTIRIAHVANVLHRDLKPENIIVRCESSPDIVIVDYGLSFNNTEDQLTKTRDSFDNDFIHLPETRLCLKTGLSCPDRFSA